MILTVATRQPLWPTSDMVFWGSIDTSSMRIVRIDSYRPRNR